MRYDLNCIESAVKPVLDSNNIWDPGLYWALIHLLFPALYNIFYLLTYLLP